MRDAQLVSLHLLEYSSATRKAAQIPKSDYPDRGEPNASMSCATPHCLPMGARMPDLSRAIAVLHSMRPSMSPEFSTWGTDWKSENPLAAERVPGVPNVPARNKAQLAPRETVGMADVLERAAILEFCEGLPRKQADAQAVTEFALPSSEVLAFLHSDASA